ncbi:HET-domain-containing protein [Thozetella sp. PMI_491]|nr:HET-domain-containing protein [Thozetella sp. PMI_491]
MRFGWSRSLAKRGREKISPEVARDTGNKLSQLTSTIFSHIAACSIHEICDGNCGTGERAEFIPLLVGRQSANEVPSQKEPLPVIDRAAPRVIGELGVIEGFNYKNLALEAGKRQIRLLRIKPALYRADFVDLDIILVSLDYAPCYSALSYCWGTAEADREIICNGKAFTARASLEGALKRVRPFLRGQNRIIYLWADAICINQEDDVEKADQLPLMRDIYRTADSVLVDLGDVDITWFPAFDLINRAGFLAEAGEYVGALPPRDDPTNCWDLLMEIFDRPWFTRRWIIQEYILAKVTTLFLGRFYINADVWEVAFARLWMSPIARNLGENLQVNHFGYMNMRSLIDYRVAYLYRNAARQYTYLSQRRTDSSTMALFHTSPAFADTHILQDRIRKNIGIRLPPNLSPEEVLTMTTPINLIRKTQDFQCTEDKDHLWSIAALMDDKDRNEIGSYALPTDVMFTNFAKSQALRGGDALFMVLDVSGLERPRHTLRDMTPSWVPDWCALSRSWTGDMNGKAWILPVSNLTPGRCPFRVARATTPKVSSRGVNNNERSALCLEGFILDEITVIHPSAMMSELLQGLESSRPADLLDDELQLQLQSLLSTMSLEPLTTWITKAQSLMRDPSFACSKIYRKGIESAFSRLLIMNNDYTNRQDSRSVDTERRIRQRDTMPITKPLDTLERLLQHYRKPGGFYQATGGLRYRDRDCMHAYEDTFLTALLCTGVFAITKSGYMALVGRSSKPGDHVCIFSGAQVPYVLRTAEQSDTYRLIGSCYVQGVMDGEAMRRRPTMSQIVLI